MSCASEYAPQLRARGFRMTPQRMAILHVLRHAGTHLSPGQVYRRAKGDLPGLTEPTVYRTLEFLAQNALVHPAHTVNGHLTYEISDDNHHHIVCRHCGSEMAVEHDLLQSLYRQLESATGYLQIDNHLTFFGVCPNCQKTLL
jgi:Fur family peroxide stress response transcriptional regulator